jgi:hypothetical protein
MLRPAMRRPAGPIRPAPQEPCRTAPARGRPAAALGCPTPTMMAAPATVPTIWDGMSASAGGVEASRCGKELDGDRSRPIHAGPATAHHRGDEDHEIAQTLAATVPNAELFVYPQRGALLRRTPPASRRATPLTRPRLLQALVGDEFRAARWSHTLETTGRCWAMCCASPSPR